jgi:hypothetical protein
VRPRLVALVLGPAKPIIDTFRIVGPIRGQVRG